MPSTRRRLLTTAGAATAALAGCFETGPGDGTDTETDVQNVLRLDAVTADEITPADTVGSFGPVLTGVLSDMVDITGTEPEPFVVGGRIRTRGNHHGETPPFAPFEAIEVRGENLIIDAEQAVPYRPDHVAEAVDEVPSDAPVIDAGEHPERVVAPIIAVIESGRESIAGWSAAFQLLDDNAHTGGGFDDMTAYVTHDGEDYRIRRQPGTPTPYPGYAFVVRAGRADRDPDATLSLFDPDEAVRGELESAVKNGAVGDASTETVDAIDPYDYLLSDYGFYEATVDTQ